MSLGLVDCLATTEGLAEVFSDRSVLQRMLDFESALARAGAAAGMIPDTAARAIAGAARAEGFDVAALAREARRSATPSVGLVKALRDRVAQANPESAAYVHRGATSQDVSDTALVLILKDARSLIAADHKRLATALRALSERHQATVMLARTLLQPALPTTFGLKAAGWYASVARSWRRLDGAWTDALVVELGGAVGTRAALGEHARQIADGVAKELGLAVAAPWHTDRDRLGAVMSAAGLYVAALGKIARDVALLMQFEVGEVAEAGGGSSTLPQKRNPAASIVTVGAATRMPGLVASFLSGMLQEHERAAGGGQAEWPTVAAAVQTTGAAVAALAGAIEGLSVDVERMRANVAATRGAIFAEPAVLLLAPHVGYDTAQALVSTALNKGRESGTTLAAALQSLPDVSRALPADVIAGMDDPQRYLGDAERLRRELLDDITD